MIGKSGEEKKLNGLMMPNFLWLFFFLQIWIARLILYMQMKERRN